MTGLPTGTVTFLFTDIEESTRLLQQLGDRYAEVLATHHRLLRAAIQEAHGHEMDAQGDALFVAFPRATDALLAAVAAQRALRAHSWPDGIILRVRMGLHTGEPLSGETGYVGMDVHRAARICAAGHGGQILVSDTTHALVTKDLPHELSLRDLGEHRLRDLTYPQRLFQVVTPDLPSEFPPLKSLSVLSNNLPRQSSSFVGREREMAEVKRLLSTTYLLTLTGPGGSGKTRLALQVATELLEHYPHGVWLAQLASLSDPALVPTAVASALGIPERPGRPLIETVADYLRPRSLLLLLDNCEHLLQACADLADALLQACTNLRIFATSREALGVTGELTYRVPALSLPDLTHPPSPDMLATYEAVRLFVERAAFSKPGFQVTLNNAAAVAQVTQRLDGIPLAIELAAARVNALPLELIAARLDDLSQLLRGSRTALPRHRTLQATLDWSYNLLSEQERILFRRLSVFAGGFTVEAAETVCAGNGLDSGDALDLLVCLVGKSLVVFDEQDGQPRYRLLETIRQYGKDKLQASVEADPLRGRHAEYYLVLAERALPRKPSLGGEGSALEVRLGADYDNYRAALDWSETEAGGADIGLRLAEALEYFWQRSGRLREGRERLERLLTAARMRGASNQSRAKGTFAAGALALFQGGYDEARSLLGESLALWRQVEEPERIVRCLNALGMTAQYQGNYRDARTLFEESHGVAQQLNDPDTIADVLMHQGLLAHEQGDYAEARSFLEYSLVNRRQAGNSPSLGPTLSAVGYLALDQGDLPRARAAFEERLALWRRIGDLRSITLSVASLGSVALAEGDHTTARRLFEESVIIATSGGEFGSLAAFILADFATLALAQGRADVGLRLAGAASRHREELGPPRAPSLHVRLRHVLDSVKRTIRTSTETAFWDEGRALSVEDAVAYALRETSHAPDRKPAGPRAGR